ncbi:MAG: ABC transporter ATP-binding protein [Culicoidibacterales bacterium]
MSHIILACQDIEKSYRTGDIENSILKGISYEFVAGKFYSILGKSGSGKTTFLNTLSTIEKPDAGSVFIEGKDIYAVNKQQLRNIRKDNVGHIFQNYNLFSHLTAWENIMISAQLAKTSKAEVMELLEKVDMVEHKDKFPYQLSGGQQQRIAICRALAKRAKILFCDEPTGALDQQRSTEILKLLKDIQLKENVTIIMVTHDQNVKELADHNIFLVNGRIEEA